MFAKSVVWWGVLFCFVIQLASVSVCVLKTHQESFWCVCVDRRE